MNLVLTAILLGILVVVAFWLIDQLSGDANTRIVKVVIVVAYVLYLILALAGKAPTLI